MAMNREQKRLLQRQGYLGADGEPVQRARQAPTPQVKAKRTAPRQFVREVWAELRKVAWPTRSEVMHYSGVVLAFLVVFTALVALLDWILAKGVLWLFGVG